ncbi:MAG: calcium-translocating P-type ATPase, SERCA-type, partial [Methanomicrobiales archaeon]|nr:calcium-translocating P-type ATPase, SERCA-type [Methanomicrobiales archaeon]
FAGQFTDILIVILAIAAIISGFLQEWLDAYAILVIILLNGAIGFLHEYKAERALEALKKMTAPRARVIRDGLDIRIDARGLVPGDIILLEEGDRIPCDGRLIETVSLEADESALTGESIPVRKDAIPILSKDQPLQERDNMIFLGTVVTRGRGRALVTATGMYTELGKIAKIVAEEPEHTTPLQKKLQILGKQISVAALLIVALVFLLGLLHGFPPFDMFLVAVSLAVAAIPEGLPAVVTITLAIGVQRMARKHAIIRRLPAVETLGAATVICTDKTGTLTKNEMTARQIYVHQSVIRVTGEGYSVKGSFLDAETGRPVIPLNSEDGRELLSTGVLCNNSNLVTDDKTGVPSIVGDPTEGSLVVLAEKAGLRQEELRRSILFKQELPFDPARKMMTVIREHDGRMRAYTKGAPELLIARSTRILRDGIPVDLSEQERQEILERNRQMASQALRVLGFAWRDLSNQWDEAHVEEDLVFLGLIGMMDPPRPEVKAAIQACHTAGIRVVMITGDNPVTASAIGQELGFLDPEREGVLTGAELDAYTDTQLQDIVERAVIYARVSPEHKLRIVDALKARGEIVAMTGDGVNDAPAIKRSDIGVAMGLTGTDVAREASDMVISDDNFASIEHAVEEGRVIYENIMKSVKYLISCNIGELIAIFLAIMVGLRSPLTPIQILWMNIVTDGPPALALAMDPPNPQIMKRPPISPQEKILNRQSLVEMFLVGLLVALGTLGIFVWYLNGGPLLAFKAGTMAFSVIILFQKFFALAVSGSGEQLIVETGFFRNRWLWLAIAFGFLSQILITEWSPVQTIFSTVHLTFIDWVVVILVSSTAFLIPESVKIVRNRGKRGEYQNSIT